MQETFAQRLRRLREGRVWTQSELAKRSGVPVVTISRLENEYNRGHPRQSTVIKLAAALEVSPPYLLFGEDRYIKAAA